MSNREMTAAAAPATASAAVSNVTANEDLKAPWRFPMGRRAVDKLTDVVGTPLHKFSPMFGNSYNNGLQLRTVLGNAYFLLLAASGVLGALAVRNTHGLAIPPVLWLTLVITVIGIFDAFSGFIATLVFTLGVVFSGHLFSSHLVQGPPGKQGMLYAFTGLLTMAFLWFIGPRLPRMIRLLGFNSIKERFQRRYVMIGDFFVVTLLMILILGSLPIFVPIFTGADHEGLTQVVLQNHLVIIKWVVGISAFLRVGLDEFVHARFQQLPKSVGRQRGRIGTWLLRLVAAAIALALVWEILGTIWQWPVVWILVISLNGLSALGERFLRPSSIYKYVPRNLFRIVTLLLFDEYAARELTGKFVTGTELLGWLVLLLVIVVAIYAILDGPDDLEEGDRSATWWTRIIGIIVVIVLFIISQDLYSIPATAYANPSAVAVSANGYLYIADSGNGRVIEVAPDGDRARVGGNFDNPQGVAPAIGATMPSIYVADSGANAVYRVTLKPAKDLVSESRFGRVAYADAATSMVEIGSGFSDPTGLATNIQGALFIADTGNNRIVEIEPSGQQITFASGLSGPTGLSTDPFGHLFVANTGAGTVLRYLIGPNGASKGFTTMARGLDSPVGVAADGQANFYVADTGANKVVEYLNNTKVIKVKGSFVQPRGIAVDGEGHLYIADAGAGEIILSEPVFPYHVRDVGPASTATAASLAPDGSTWVVSLSGETLEHVTSTGDTVVDRDLNEPSGICWSAIGRLYISETGNGTIDQVNPTTGAITLLAHDVPGVTDLTPNPYGGMYALSPSTGSIYYVTAQGKVQRLIKNLPDPTSVVQDAYGNINVTVQGSKVANSQLWRIRPAGRADILLSHLHQPVSLEADFRGDLFFVDLATHTVWEDRGLLGDQIVWQGHSSSTNPVAVVTTTEGDLTIFTQHPGITIHLHNTTTNYQL